MQVDEPGDGFLRGWGLVESNMSCSADAQDLQINPSIAINFLLIVLTVLCYFFSGHLTIWNVDIFLRDVDVIEKVVAHVVIVGF